MKIVKRLKKRPDCIQANPCDNSIINLGYYRNRGLVTMTENEMIVGGELGEWRLVIRKPSKAVAYNFSNNTEVNADPGTAKFTFPSNAISG